MVEDSKSMYNRFLLEARDRKYNPDDTEYFALQLIKKIDEEISQPPYSLTNSPFIQELLKAVSDFDSLSQDCEISVDLCAITISLTEYLYGSRDWVACKMCRNYAQLRQLFRDRFRRGEEARQSVNIVRECLNKLNKILINLNEQRKQNIPRRVQSIPVTPLVPSQPEDRKTSLAASPFPKTTPASYTPRTTAQPPVSRPRGDPPYIAPIKPQVFPNINIQKQESPRAEEQPSMTAAQARAEQERIQAMTDENKALIKEWHEIQKGFVGELREAVPVLRDALKKIMSLPEKITEDFVLKCAKSYVRLYNLIYDGLTSHKENAAQSSCRDYQRVVLNFEGYCRVIVQELASFGVSEIKTKPGSPFDGVIHEAMNTSSFDSSRARVTESIRAGFRYADDVIIQKEEVNVGG